MWDKFCNVVLFENDHARTAQYAALAALGASAALDTWGQYNGYAPISAITYIVPAPLAAVLAASGSYVVDLIRGEG